MSFKKIKKERSLEDMNKNLKDECFEVLGNISIEYEELNVVYDYIEELEKEIKVNNLMLKLKDKKIKDNEFISKDKIIELLNKNSKFNFIYKKEIEELLNK